MKSNAQKIQIAGTVFSVFVFRYCTPSHVDTNSKGVPLDISH